MRRGCPVVELTLTLTDDERKTLTSWTRRGKTAQSLAQRARIVLACAEGKSNTDVAEEMRISRLTVGRWRGRFVDRRLDGLIDEPRSGRPRTVIDADVERVVRQTLETLPQDATHWSTRSIAAASGLSRTTISRIWRAFSLQPHRTETFKVSADPLFVDKVRDIAGLYLNLLNGRSCCAWTRSRRFRRLIAHVRSCQCVQARPNEGRMTTFAVALRLCLSPST